MAALLVTVCACAATRSQRQLVGQQAAADFAPGERDQVFSRALSVAQQRGWRIAASEPSAGAITSEAMDTGKKPCGILACDSTSTLEIVVPRNGRLVVRIRRELDVVKAYGSAAAGVGAIQRDEVPAEAEGLVAEILGARHAMQDTGRP